MKEQIDWGTQRTAVFFRQLASASERQMRVRERRGMHGDKKDLVGEPNREE